MSRRTEQLIRHDLFLGFVECTADEGGWTFQPLSKYHPELLPLVGQRYTSRAALLTAIDDCLGPERIADLKPASEEREARRTAQWAWAEARARERTFTGDRYDAERPIRETARRIEADLRAAVAAGELPPDRFKVTVRASRWTDGYDTRVKVWAWRHPREIEKTVGRIADRYNKREGRPYEGDPHDLQHFDL